MGGGIGSLRQRQMGPSLAFFHLFAPEPRLLGWASVTCPDCGRHFYWLACHSSFQSRAKTIRHRTQHRQNGRSGPSQNASASDFTQQVCLENRQAISSNCTTTHLAAVLSAHATCRLSGRGLRFGAGLRVRCRQHLDLGSGVRNYPANG